MLQGPLKTLDADCSKEEKQYAEWVTVRARVALLEVNAYNDVRCMCMSTTRLSTCRPHLCLGVCPQAMLVVGVSMFDPHREQRC